jgi:hypothetical protein
METPLPTSLSHAHTLRLYLSATHAPLAPSRTDHTLAETQMHMHAGSYTATYPPPPPQKSTHPDTPGHEGLSKHIWQTTIRKQGLCISEFLVTPHLIAAPDGLRPAGEARRH